jgi:hypothetical protein
MQDPCPRTPRIAAHPGASHEDYSESVSSLLASGHKENVIFIKLKYQYAIADSHRAPMATNILPEETELIHDQK